MTARPFADAVVAYAQAGWPCIFPVPIDKAPPPPGFTGADGADTDPLQLVRWATTHPDSSIALRMPDGVIGIDVDDYAKGEITKHGAVTLAAAVERWGALPATWSSTARGAGPSRISFYRVPEQRYATKLGPDVEIIQRHHRYAVVWPSPHKDAGDTYRWYGPDGTVSDTPPKPVELPELPAAWVAGLLENATDVGPAAADIASGESMLRQILADTRPACAEIASAVMHAHTELRKVDAGSRHDTAIARVHQLVMLAGSGHTGLGLAAPELAALWADLTAGEERGEEFERMLLTSARKAVTAVGAAPVTSDPCLFTGGLEIAAPAPGDDRPDAPPLEPIELPRELHPLEVIGAHPFVTRARLDQKLAEAVLERMYPMLRYGYDAGTWVVRGRTHWETQAELAEWAVSTVAATMPRGSADAEKGSEEREQAELRTRFMTAAKSAGIAKKMRSVVARGSHPCALRVGELDSEPWLLWAGGVGWDLSASATTPTLAQVDPATPHLRSAGVAPEARPTPLWDAFTAAVWPDPELRAWALRVLSITFTGYSDKALPIMIGERDRGKTQVVVLLMSVLGSYAHAADPRLLGAADKAHASIVYALKGRRLSFIDEGPRDGRLGQERLKQLTGGGDLTANEMNRNPITFTPTHTLVLTANDEPVLTDAAVRGRVRLIPCEGDPDQVRAARAAIGHVSGRAWRAEAPGVLAALMRQAAGWLADQDSALTERAPEAYRHRAEVIATEQDPLLAWLDEETEVYPEGTRSRELYEALVGWCKNGNLHPSRIPNETKFGRALTELGYPLQKTRAANFRPLRLKPRAPWLPGGGLAVFGGGFVEGGGFAMQPSTAQQNPTFSAPPVEGVEGVEGCNDPLAHTRTHDTRDAHTCVRVGENPPPSTVDLNDQNLAQNTGATAGWRVSGQTADNPPHEPESAKITAKLLAARDEAKARDVKLSASGEPVPVDAPRKARAPKLTPEERAEAKAAAAQAKLEQRIAAAAGDLVQLPAAVTRDGAVRPLELAAVPELIAAFDSGEELTVDVEHSGYPIGHQDYELRTIQLGGENLAVVLDAGEPAHRELAARLLADASVLHAHSATADLIPLADAGVITDLDHAWARMHDTAIPAKLADPSSTGNDADLKGLARAVLGPAATSPAADDARAELFKAGRWLTEVKTTTPVARSGWAQVDRRCATMIRYAASDVLDDAALARRLPPVAPHVLERERTAQRMTARVTDRGLALDRDQVARLLPQQRAALADAGGRLREFGIDNPGSDQQAAARAIELGAQLPRTKTGRPSVAKGVLEPYRTLDSPLGAFVRARLDYQKAETALGLFLEPYDELVHRGDGRARPTIYTLGADTGRMSCVRPNLQQMPREGGFRACITADPGQLLVSADFASVEIRVMAALSGDGTLRRMLIEGTDVHSVIAAQVFGPGYTKTERYMVKRGVFGWAYGGSVPTLAKQVGATESAMAAVVDTLAEMAPEYVRWSYAVKDAVKAGQTQFPSYSGRVIHLPRRFPHKAANYAIQGTARELLVDTLVRLRDTRWGTATLLPVHDEVLLVVPEADAATATADLVAAMETDLHGIPIKAEASQPAFAWSDAS